AALAPLRVIKAIAFTSRQVTAKLSPWRGTCANLIGILYDAPPPAADDGPTLPGGTGRTLDWEDLAKLEHGGVLAGLPPMVLAGGLNAANVGRAIELLQPDAVDISSGVESSRGVKDAARITAFCRAVREADGVCAQRIHN
ncbi:MAG: hypothetical protein V3U29_05180, partial [Phycisphaeraceae bacterium]